MGNKKQTSHEINFDTTPGCLQQCEVLQCSRFSTPPLVSAIIPSMGKLILPAVNATVVRKGQVKVFADLNLIIRGVSDLQESNILFDLLRDEKSIVNGPQVFFHIGLPFLEGSYSVSTIDETAPVGDHVYTFTLTNNFSSPLTVVESRNENFLVVQKYPKMGTVALEVKSGQTTQIDLPVVKLRPGSQSKITLSANLITPLPVSALFDILKNGKSIIRGPQTVIRIGRVNPGVTQEENFQFEVVDFQSKKEKVFYSLQFINSSSGPTASNYEVDFFSFHADVVRVCKEEKEKKCASFFATQLFKPLGEFIKNIPPQGSASFSLEVDAKNVSAIRLSVAVDITVPSTGDNVQFDITSGEDKISLINGPQTLSEFVPPGMPPLTAVSELNFSPSVMDRKPLDGRRTYELTFYNKGTATIMLDILSFNAEI